MGKIVTENSNHEEDRLGILAILRDLIGPSPLVKVHLAHHHHKAPHNSIHPNRARIFISLSGCRNFIVSRERQRQEVQVRKREALYVNFNAWHVGIIKKQARQLVVRYDPEYTSFNLKEYGPLAEDGKFLMNHLSMGRCDSESWTLLGLLSKASRQKVPETIVSDLVSALLKLAIPMLESASEPDPDHAWQQISAYLEDHFHENLSREKLAELFHIHPNHLSRLFKRHTGTSFQERLNKCRMDHALVLLRDTSLSVGEISRYCGIPDANYFAKVFRKAFGQSPSEFR